MRSLFFILFLYFLASVSYAGTIDPGVSDQKYIDNANNFEFIYEICGTYKDGQLFCASAVIIDKKWAVTAAHVVQNSRFSIISRGTSAHLIDKVIIHNDFNINNIGYADIALCRLSTSLILEKYPQLYTERDEEGKLCSISGYGSTGTFKTGSILSDSKQRAGTNRIDSIDKELLICNASSKDDPTVTNLEFLIAGGDSGGGLFIKNKLAGINSCVMATDKKTNSSYSDESAHTRVSTYADWIIEEMSKE